MRRNINIILFILIIINNINAKLSIDSPNIILLMADDQGWGDTGYNHITSNPAITPNLDKMAKSSHSILFDRFYASSAVCSPTRSSVLTGRTSNRDCIPKAEGCGTKPAYSCYDPYPLPPPTFSIAEAVKRSKYNYTTTHIGKWHLGDFWNKHDPHPNYAKKKWPISNPLVHGFDEFHSTEASAPSSTTNCGCFSPIEHCIHGGGKFSNTSYGCTNYWFPDSKSPTGVTNLTEKILGDDSKYIMDQFEMFLQKQLNKHGQQDHPFMSVIWLHTVHVPHPAMPEYYDLYGNEEDGDYLGTIAQMDNQIGRLRSMLSQYGVSNDTLLFFTADNGPAYRQKSTAGLRACKASLWEGGIRVPGIVEWPAKIKSNRRTKIPAYTSDYISTIMDLLNVTSPFNDSDPLSVVDGTSIMPIINNEWTTRPSNHPLVFHYEDQVSVIDNDFKYLHNPSPGFCKYQKPYDKNSKGPFLYNLEDDVFESKDLSKHKNYTTKFKELHSIAQSFVQSVKETSAYCRGPGSA